MAPASAPAPRFLPWFPLVVDDELYAEINPFLPEPLSVVVFITAAERSDQNGGSSHHNFI